MSDMKTSVPIFNALHIPPPALEQGGVEVLRVAIVDGALHVVAAPRVRRSGRPGACVIADITSSTSRSIYATETSSARPRPLKRIRAIVSTPRWTRRRDPGHRPAALS